MKRRSTPFAILGMLSLGPMSGYEIRKEAASSIGHFWSESYGQIYPALRELAAAGLARRSRETAGRADRRVFEITPAGRDALRRWLEEPPHPAPLRNELLLKLFFADRDSIGAQVRWIERLRDQQQERRREYATLRRRLMREQRAHSSLRFWLLTLSYGEHHAAALEDWSKKALAELRAIGAKARATRARKQE